MESLVELFCDVDDFSQEFKPILEKHMLESGIMKHRPARSLAVSEIMTILIHFHQSHYRDFKAYYWNPVKHAYVSKPEDWLYSTYKEWRKKDFTNLVGDGLGSRRV